MRLASLCVLVLFPVAAVRADDKPAEPVKVSAKVKKELGERTVAVLTGADKVEVLRLKAAEKPKRKQPAPKAGAPTIGSDKFQFPIAATAKEPAKDLVAKFRDLVFNETTDPEPFDDEDDTFGPGADFALRFWKEKESVTVVVSFEDWTFLVITRDAVGKQTRTTIGEILTFNRQKRLIEKTELFATARTVARGAFPMDVDLKELKTPVPEDINLRAPVGDTIPENILAALKKGEPFELFSLNPRPEKNAEGTFHKYKILGSTTVKDAETREKLIAALKKGVEDNDGAAAGCFNPRHGIRVKHDGKTWDFVICFECLFAQVYVDDTIQMQGLRTTGSPKSAFNRVLKDAKVPLPKE